MKYNQLKSLDKAKLRRWLFMFFISLAVPTALLVQQSYSRLKWEAFHQYQVMAEELSRRINRQLLQMINTEEQRAFTDYSFLNVAGVPTANFLQRSPLSRYPVQSDIPGLIGYFQVDAAGKLLTPFVPEPIEKAASYGIADKELSERLALQNMIQYILAENRLLKNDIAGKLGQEKKTPAKAKSGLDSGLLEAVKNVGLSDSLQNELDYEKSESPNEPAVGQAAFDELRKAAPRRQAAEKSLGRIEEFNLTQRDKKESGQPEPSLGSELSETKLQKKRTERSVLPELPKISEEAGSIPYKKDNLPAASPASPDSNNLRIKIFESALDPFEFSQLNSGHFVLFRKVWLNDQRYIQGLLIERDAFLLKSIRAAFSETVLSQMSNLLVAFQGNVLSAYSGRASRGFISSSKDFRGELLYQTQLSDPFNELKLVFSVTDLPVGPGGWVIIWLSIVLTIVFLAGFFLMYRHGVSQINLVNQQQDFVSAVSHELKTPLTSIRMYGEMLQAGWVDDAKKKFYYDFILDESERLSRLINNVLQLAKMTRNEQRPELKSLTVAELLDGVRSKVSSQVEHAEFELRLMHDGATAQTYIKVNTDWFMQIMINLIDNAIKFSAKTDKKIIELSCQRLSNDHIQFKVRDYGSGIAKGQMKKIFKLFYRSENELTRETVGTGIGLALTQQMAVGMKGEIDVVNSNPGAEFRITFPVVK